MLIKSCELTACYEKISTISFYTSLCKLERSVKPFIVWLRVDSYADFPAYFVLHWSWNRSSAALNWSHRARGMRRERWKSVGTIERIATALIAVPTLFSVLSFLLCKLVMRYTVVICGMTSRNSRTMPFFFFLGLHFLNIYELHWPADVIYIFIRY